MWLDVFLFATGAFWGTPDYVSVMQGTLVSRLAISVFAFPVLYLYLEWQNRQPGVGIENRPVLAILREVAEVRAELTQAQREIERRKQAEREKEELIKRLEATLAHVNRLEGLLPVCSSCKRIRVDQGMPESLAKWVTLEEYVRSETSVQFSHGMCVECIRKVYPAMADDIIAEMGRRDDDAESLG